MTKKKEATDSIKAEAEAEEIGYKSPIYLTLNGNNGVVNLCYLRQCLEHVEEYGNPLYVTSNVGGPPNPPSCPPGWPC